MYSNKYVNNSNYNSNNNSSKKSNSKNFPSPNSHNNTNKISIWKVQTLYPMKTIIISNNKEISQIAIYNKVKKFLYNNNNNKLKKREKKEGPIYQKISNVRLKIAKNHMPQLGP